MQLTYKKALIIGGSTGSGKEIALRLVECGVDTTVVARGLAQLEKLVSTEARIKIRAEDASIDGAAVKLLSDLQPDLLVLCAGHQQKMAPFFEQDWDKFSGAWNTDTKIAHAFMSAAITQPMISGAAVVSFSSGAGLSGSRLSGGYAGAKRMQHFIAEYAEREAELRNLGLTFYTIIPKQLVSGTNLGHAAGEAYAAALGKPFEQFMKQWDEPLTPKKISQRVIELLNNKNNSDSRSFIITGTGIQAH